MPFKTHTETVSAQKSLQHDISSFTILTLHCF